MPVACTSACPTGPTAAASPSASTTSPRRTGPGPGLTSRCRASRPDQVISVSYPLRRTTQNVTVGGKPYRITWRGDTVIAIDPPGERDQLYQRAAMDTDVVPMATVANAGWVPDTYFIQDAAVAAGENILARLDTAARLSAVLSRSTPFADPPYAVPREMGRRRHDRPLCRGPHLRSTHDRHSAWTRASSSCGNTWRACSTPRTGWPTPSRPTGRLGGPACSASRARCWACWHGTTRPARPRPERCSIARSTA